MSNETVDSTEATEQEEPARTERKGRGLVKISNHVFKTGGGDKPEPPRIIETVHRPPQVAPRKIKDTATIAAKRAELARLELELKNADRERRTLELRLEGVEHQIDASTRQLSIVANDLRYVESEELGAEFLLLFRRSLRGDLGQHDSINFARVGLALSNRKLLISALQGEAKELDARLANLEKENEALREKLGPDAESEAA